ncbi:MAG TPA: AI-2E family transporter [Gemmataceae bacterium]|nr:AI-2E family transporter [Gemmataceae bacterium]
MAVASSPNPNRSLLIVCTSILALLAIAALQVARTVLIPLALSVLLTFILAPAVTRLQHRGLGRLISVLLVGGLVFLAFGGIGVAITLQAKSLANDLPAYQENVTNKIARLREASKGKLLQEIQDAVSAITKALSKSDQDAPAAAQDQPTAVRMETSGLTKLEAIANPTLELLATAGLVAVLVIFMLINREELRNRLIRLVGHGRLTGTTKALDDAGQRISRFLIMQLLINAGFGLVLGLGVWAIGVPYAVLWGFLAGMLRFVPYLGGALTGLLLLTFSVAAFSGWIPFFLVLALFIILEISAAQIFEPLLFGHSTGVSPVALLVAAVFWTWLWGPIGLLLSTPLTVCLVVLGKHVPGLEFFGVILGDTPALALQVGYYQRLMARDQDEAAAIVQAYLKELPEEQLYDELLVPALAYARQDRERDALTEQDEQYILRATREIMEELGERPAEIPSAAMDVQATPLPPPKNCVLGFPARGEADRLALEMLQQLLDPAQWAMEIAPPEMHAAAAVALTREKDPSVICIGSLPPGGLIHTRFLCKRLRTQFPKVKIVAGRWGLKANVEQHRESLLSAGADNVDTTLLETRDHLSTWFPSIPPEELAAPLEAPASGSPVEV